MADLSLSESQSRIPDVSGIYEIRNTVTGKRYIGSAKRLRLRFTQHRARLRGGKHHSRHLQASWIKHGEQTFVFRVLLLCDPKNLLLYEQILITGFTPKYNVCPTAGNTLGIKCSEETRAKISAKALGRIWTAEARAKLSATLKGRKAPAAHIERMTGNKFAAGTVYSVERRKLISQWMTGQKRPKSDEHREKIAATLRGRKATPESRANQSAAQRGKRLGPRTPWSEETKRRVAEARALKPPVVRNFVYTPEVLKRMSDAQKGKKQTETQKARTRSFFRLKWADAEWRAMTLQRQAEGRALKPRAPKPKKQKIQKTFKASVETRLKMSQAKLGTTWTDARRKAEIAKRNQSKNSPP